MTDRARRLVIAIVALGLAAMFASSLAYRMGDHPLTRHIASSSAPSSEAMRDSVPPQEAPDPQNAAIMALMQKMQQDPHNVDTMLEISSLFAAQGNTESAKSMLERAALTAPSDPRPPYLLGVQLAQAGQWDEAARSLERSLSLKDDASTRYSLGVIFRYHLQQEEKAREQFEKAASICTNASLSSMIETELKK